MLWAAPAIVGLGNPPTVSRVGVALVEDQVARLWYPPPAIAVTPERPPGTEVWPALYIPQATTVPAVVRARLWYSPAAMADTPDRPVGTVVWP